MIGRGNRRSESVKPMRILIHGINFSPELTGIGKYTGEMAAWLAARGHDVRVVTAPPYYPEWKIAGGFRNRYQRQVQDTRRKGQDESGNLELDPCALQLASCPLNLVTVFRCPLWVPASPSGLKRLLHLASFALSSLPIMLRHVFWRPDVVWVAAPAFFCSPGAWLTARLSGARCWLHVQDYEVDAAFDLGLLKGKWLKKLVLALERWMLRRFDVVSTISRRMLDRARDKGVRQERLVFFPNWVDVSAIAPTSAQDASGKAQGGRYREEFGIPDDAVVALYSGNMGAKQGLEILAEAAKQLQVASEKQAQGSSYKIQGAVGLEPCPLSLFFVFCGNGAGRAGLESSCAGLPNVRFLDLQPMERLGELLTMADIHLLPQRADVADLVMPSKLTGMLASGRPVVATAHAGTELASVVQGCGLVVPPEDAAAFADAIAALAADRALRNRYGAAARDYAEQYLDRIAVLGKFESAMKLGVESKKSGIVG